MNLGASSATNINQNTSNIFIEAWVYFIDFTVAHRIFVRAPDAVSPAGTVDIVFRTSSTTLYFNYGTGGVAGGANGPSALTAGRWYHVAISSVVGGGNSYCFMDGVPGTGIVVAQDTYNAAYTSIIGAGSSEYSNMYLRDLRVVQGGVVPVANFTPGAAPFSYASPTYVPNMGTTVFTLLGQFITYNPSGKYGSSLRIQNYPTGGNSNVANTYITWTSSLQASPVVGYSISLWVKVLKFPNSGDSETIFQYGDSRISVFYDGTSQFALNDGTTNPSTFPSGFLSDTWVHFTGVISSSSVTGYINGVLSGTPAVNTVSRSVAGILNLGNLSGGRPMSAELDDLRIYNTALTAAQVQSVYSSQGAPAPSRAMPLPKLAWDFNGTTTDYVSGLTGTTTGTVSYNASGKYGSSLVITNTEGVVASNYVNYNTPYYPSTLTTAVWIKLNTISAGQQYFIEFGGTSGGISYVIYINSNNTVVLRNQALSGGSTVATTISTVATVNAGQWYHIAAVIDGYNQTIYLNGVIAAGPNPCNTLEFQYRNLTLGGSNNLTRVLVNGELDDLRIFDRALTSAQVQAIYNQQGVPGRGASGLSLPLDKVSGQVSGAYSTRLIRTGYTGPVVRVRRNSDSTQLDFISDVTGNLSNVSSAVTIGSWLSSTTGNVSTWYDQSGGSNNFTQSITSQQPQIVQNGGKWVLWFNRDATPTFYSNLNCATTMTGIKTIVYNFNTIYNNYQTILGSEQADNTGFRFSSNRIIGDAQGGRLGSDFLAAAGSYWYLNGAYGYMISNDGTTGVPSGNYTYNDLAWNHVVGVQNGGGMDGFGFNAISSPQLPIKNRAMNGYMSEIILFRNQLSAADSLYLYNSRYVSRGSQISLTGTPLFTQLSPAARSSAVGAFSLRAVNGTSARAVNVAPGGTFPPSAMTQTGTNSSTQTLGTGGKFQGSYIASSSTSAYGWGAPGAFALNNSGNQYIWQVGNYPAGGGSLSTPTTTTTGATNYNGEWLQFQTHFPINLTGYSANTGFLTSAVLLASTTGATSSWILVDSKSAITPGSIITNTGLNFAGYSYFRFVLITSSDIYPLLGNVRFFGTVPSLAQDFYADRLGNLLTAPVTGQTLAKWLGGGTGYVTTWYDQSGAGQHMAQTTTANQPVISTLTQPASLIFTGTEYFQNTIPFTFNFGSGAFTFRYVVSNNTGGIVLYKADSADFVWSQYEKKFWLGNGTTAEGSRGGYPSQVGNSENYILAGAPAIGSTKTSVVHKATSTTAIPIYVNGTIQTLAANALTMRTDPGNWLFIGKAGGTSYIGNIHELQIFSTALSDADRLALEN
jgi:hypothetical protein